MSAAPTGLLAVILLGTSLVIGYVIAALAVGAGAIIGRPLRRVSLLRTLQPFGLLARPLTGLWSVILVIAVVLQFTGRGPGQTVSALSGLAYIAALLVAFLGGLGTPAEHYYRDTHR